MRKPSGKGFVQAGALLTRRVRTASEKRGFAETRLLTQWETICGPEIAGIARPLRVSYSRDGFGATLLVTCDGARAPEVQMQTDAIRQKVNACYGYNAISRVRITQTDSTGFAEAQARYRTQGPDTGTATTGTRRNPRRPRRSGPWAIRNCARPCPRSGRTSGPAAGPTRQERDDMTLPLSRRATLALGLGALAMPRFALAQEARTVDPMILGDEAAPVTVVEYASLTCPHCARFHTDVFGKLKANYIETGKVRFEVRDVYFDRYGLWAAMVARCGGAERYFGITDILFRKQAEWSRLSDPSEAIAAMYAIGRQAGLDNATMEACVQDQAWAEALVTEFQKNMEEDQVQGTPTFFINGEKAENMGYEDFAARLDEELGS